MKPDQTAQGLVEYALVLVLVAIAVIVLLSELGAHVGNVFSGIVDNLSVEAPDSTEIARMDTFDHFLGSTDTAANDALTEIIWAFGTLAVEQESSLDMATEQLRQGLAETIVVLMAHAEEIGDEELLQMLSSLQQEIQSENFETVPEILSFLSAALMSAPLEVQAEVGAAVGNSSLAACKELSGAFVSPDAYQAAVTAVNQREEEVPGSTGNALPQLHEAWALVEQRNWALEEGVAALEEGVTLLATNLEASGEAKLVKMAQQFRSKGDGCGSLPNMPPIVKIWSGQTVAVGQSLNVSGKWKDPAGHLDEPYSWAWDLEGDGVWDITGTSLYGPMVVETISYAQTGDYTLTLMVTDKDGASGVGSLVVEVNN